MKWGDCRKCPESICELGIYDKHIDPKTGNVVSYKRGNILKTKVSVRPFCLVNCFKVFNPQGVYVNVVVFDTLLEAVTYIVDNLDLPLETMLYYMKIKNEIDNG